MFLLNVFSCFHLQDNSNLLWCMYILYNVQIIIIALEHCHLPWALKLKSTATWVVTHWAIIIFFLYKCACWSDGPNFHWSSQPCCTPTCCTAWVLACLSRSPDVLGASRGIIFSRAWRLKLIPRPKLWWRAVNTTNPDSRAVFLRRRIRWSSEIITCAGGVRRDTSGATEARGSTAQGGLYSNPTPNTWTQQLKINTGFNKNTEIFTRDNKQPFYSHFSLLSRG